jgi:glutaredoxin 3
MGARVLMYTTTYCGYCYRAKRLLQARGIAFDEVDVTNDRATRQRIIAETRHRTVPVILIDGRLIGGCDELHDLDRDGELAGLAA